MILAIETALNHCSTALINGDATLFEKVISAKNSQSEILPNLVLDCLNSANIAQSEISKIAVTIGPGSFNGVRIGLGFAKTFAMALNIECIGVSTFDVLGAEIKQDSKMAIIEIGGNYFGQASIMGKCVLPPTRLSLEELTRIELNDFAEIAFIGNSNDLDVRFHERVKIYDALSPTHLANLASNLSAIESPAVPLYLRDADAKPWSGSQYV